MELGKPPADANNTGRIKAAVRAALDRFTPDIFSPFRTGHAPEQSTQYSCAEEMFKRLSGTAGFATPIDVFKTELEMRDEFLSKYALAAIDAGFTELQIANVIIKYRYPAKLKNYVDTHKGQAAGLIMLASTIKVNWWEIFFGGRPIVENGVIMNGIFGRREPHKMSCENLERIFYAPDEVADTLYLPKSCQEGELPQAVGIAFGAKARESGGVGLSASEAVAHRRAFEEALEMGMIGNFLKIADKKHRATTKFRLACFVFDMEKGRVKIAGDDEAARVMNFEAWANENMQNLLSCDEPRLREIRNMAERNGGLVEQLLNPRNGDSAYHPWEDLKKEIKARGHNDGETYRLATKVWRYGILRIMVEYSKRYEKRWAKIKSVEKILESRRKWGCDDSRQGKDGAVLGGIMTREEFRDLIEGLRNGGGVKTEVITFAPHYQCGLGVACTSLHEEFKKLAEVLREDAKRIEHEDVYDGESERRAGEKAAFEFKRSMQFFEDSIEIILKRPGPAREMEVVLGYLPAHMQEEYWAFRADLPVINEKNRGFVKLLDEIFVLNDERMRAVIRRAYEVGVLVRDHETGFLKMPAAEKIQGDLETFFGSKYKEQFGEAVGVFIIEEVAREAYRRYSEWMLEMPHEMRLKLEMHADSFHSGRALKIPPTPKGRKDYTLKREDFYIAKFTPEEIRKYGLEGQQTWAIPKEK